MTKAELINRIAEEAGIRMNRQRLSLLIIGVALTVLVPVLVGVKVAGSRQQISTPKGTVYYVSPDGDDKNSGTEVSQPWQSCRIFRHSLSLLKVRSSSKLSKIEVSKPRWL